MVYILSIVCLVAGVAAGGYGLWNLRQARLTYALAQQERLAAVEEAARIEQQRAQLAAEIERVRQRRHTHATEQCLEDASAVTADLLYELDAALPNLEYMVNLVDFLHKRVPALRLILNAGRPGPYAYRSGTTQNRAQRPSTIRLWGG